MTDKDLTHIENMNKGDLINSILMSLAAEIDKYENASDIHKFSISVFIRDTGKIENPMLSYTMLNTQLPLTELGTLFAMELRDVMKKVVLVSGKKRVISMCARLTKNIIDLLNKLCQSNALLNYYIEIGYVAEEHVKENPNDRFIPKP